jgi:hypothetical protein
MRAGFVTALAVALVGCASADSMDGDRAESALGADDVERADLAVNDEHCPVAPPDLALAGDTATSEDELYDHANCPNRFVVTKHLSGGRSFDLKGSYEGFAGGPFPCSGSWVQLAVWKRRVTVPASSQWIQVAHTGLVQGVDPAPAPPGGAPRGDETNACKASAVVHLPDDSRAMEYKVAARAGWVFAYRNVAVTFVPREPLGPEPDGVSLQ